MYEYRSHSADVLIQCLLFVQQTGTDNNLASFVMFSHILQSWFKPSAHANIEKVARQISGLEDFNRLVGKLVTVSPLYQANECIARLYKPPLPLIILLQAFN
jgi:hypothetical protein